jgi:hypothetical protein
MTPQTATMPPQNQQRFFPHERQKAYFLALDWSKWVSEYLEVTGDQSPIKQRLREASNNLPITIAEGISSVRVGHHDRLDLARDQVITCAAALDVIDISEAIDPRRLFEAKRHLNLISRHLTSMIQAANTTDAIRSKLGMGD